MAHGLTPSERFVTELCNRSFLKLWTHPNPKGKKGKELCDCLIVCGSHIVIISVKENEYKDTGDAVGWERWTKAAIEKSASQIAGAERWLNKVEKVERHDGRVIHLPKKNKRQYHRVSVSLGAEGQVPLSWGDFGKGFIHVCDEFSVGILFSMLDTITDFVNFLTATEELVSRDILMLFDGSGLHDLLAMYLMNDCSFDFDLEPNEQPDMMILYSGMWEHFYESEHYKALREKYKDSYYWDILIGFFADDLLSEGMFDAFSKQVTNNQLAFIEMALQPRRARAVLAKQFMDFLTQKDLKIASRVVEGDNKTAFVFLIGKSSERKQRASELALRCFVIRGLIPNIETVVGIATDRPKKFEESKIGYSSDLVYLYKPTWTQEDQNDLIGIQKDLGYFEDAKYRKSS